MTVQSDDMLDVKNGNEYRLQRFDYISIVSYVFEG